MVLLLRVIVASLAGALLGVVAWLLSFGARVDLSTLANPSKLDPHLGPLDALVLAGALLVPVALCAWRRVREGVLAAPSGAHSRWVGAFAAAALAVRLGARPTTTAAFVVVAVGLAWLVAVLAHQRWLRVVGAREERMRWAFALSAGTSAFLLFSTWSVTRHLRFGSGSWDMGCYNHNAWLLGHGKPLVSSVLGDVPFLGDHFIPIMALFAPASWTGATWLLLVAQAAFVAAGVVPLAMLARRRELGAGATLGLCFAYLFAVGTQSMINFDFHEIVAVPAALLFALAGFETRRRWLAYGGLLLVVLSKESAPLYAGAVGAWLVLFRAGRRLEGLAIGAVCLAIFLVVVGWLQPKLLEGNWQGMIHLARFKGFGDSVGEVVRHIVLHPGKALLALVSPDAKLATLVVTFGGFAFLPVASVEMWLLALPNLLERFLADKREMWGLGFHYSVVLVSLSSWGALDVVARAKERLSEWNARRAGLPHERFRAGFDVAVLALLVLSTLGANAASPVAPELSSLEKPYFSSPEQGEVNRRALALIPDDAKVVAQNHFLPHLAFRQFIWQPQDRFFDVAEYAVLDPEQSPWPHNRAHVLNWVTRLASDDEWTLVFSEGTTVVFARGAAAPAVEPSTELRALLRR